MHPINTKPRFGNGSLQRFPSPPRSSETKSTRHSDLDTVDLSGATDREERSWKLGKALKMAALAGLAVSTATAAQAAPCSQDTTYQEAVIDTFQQKMEKLPEDLRTPDIMQIAASRHRINQMSIKRLDVNGNAQVNFSLNGGPEKSIHCEGDSTEIPGLEQADQGQSGLMQGHTQIINGYLAN